MGRLPWTLADFPQGYALFLHISPYKTRSSRPRRDFYLYGARLPHFPFPGRSRTHACVYVRIYEPTCVFTMTTSRLDGRPEIRLALRIRQARRVVDAGCAPHARRAPPSPFQLSLLRY